jgi:hypothetical protein
MTYQRGPGAGGSIRWEAWSHRQIFQSTQASGGGQANPLGVTVSLWREIVADLGEVRTRYEAATKRLTEVSAGVSADAAGVKSQLVTRGLTEAQEFAGLAGARRARLHELNESLRRTMPEPDDGFEDGDGFLRPGVGWLNPPEFHRAEADRCNAEERARDLMRGYERATTPEALAAANSDRPISNSALDYSRSTGDDPTIPMSTSVIAASQVAETPAAIAGQPDQPAPGAGHFSGQLGWFSRGPWPSGYSWSYTDFGPQGQVSHDHHGDPSDGQPNAASGPVPMLRDDASEFMSRRLVSEQLFDPDTGCSRPVIGE